MSNVQLVVKANKVSMFFSVEQASMVFAVLHFDVRRVTQGTCVRIDLLLGVVSSLRGLIEEKSVATVVIYANHFFTVIHSISQAPQQF